MDTEERRREIESNIPGSFIHRTNITEMQDELADFFGCSWYDFDEKLPHTVTEALYQLMRYYEATKQSEGE